MKKAVMIGAGQIGRGFIGMLLEQAGYHVVFADLNMTVVEDINARGEYTVHMVDRVCVDTVVRNISALNSLSADLIKEIEGCQLIATSVGLTALPQIAGTIAEGIAARAGAGLKDYLNIIACENAVRGSSYLKKCVRERLDPAEREYMDRYVGFPDCAVDRIIPPAGHCPAADVVTESYHEWDVEKGGFKGELPDIPGLEFVDDLTAYLERKLFTLNGPNAVTACYGYLKGCKTINEALEDEEIYRVVYGMMEECGAMLEKRHGFSSVSMLNYRDSLMRRFMNPYIIDDVVRVAREPIRKLGPTDRIVAPMNHALGWGLAIDSYITGIACVLLYDNPDDMQSGKLQRLINETGVRQTLETVSGIEAGSAVALAVESEYFRLKRLYRG